MNHTKTGGLGELIRPGARVALGDGVGAPASILGELTAAARQVGDVDLLLGWVPQPLDGLDLTAFRSVRTIMGGYALRRPIDRGEIRYLPVRLGTVPSLLHGPLRPDVVVVSVRASPDGHRFTTESAWLRSAIDAGARVAAVERSASPCADGGPPLPADRVTVVGASETFPVEATWAEPTDVHRRIAEHVVALLPPSSRVQYGPGPVGTAVIDAVTTPVRIDTGIVTDAVVDLDDRGLLEGTPVAPYLAGTERLYRWADGRPILDRLERTHDPARLGADPPLVAVNTALEIDLDAQVNVESVGGSAVAGIGGQPDYAFAAARAVNGLSVVATPTHRGRHRTLVDRLAVPASTPSHDVDVVVTEQGAADLRGLDRTERRRAIAALWD